MDFVIYGIAALAGVYLAGVALVVVFAIIIELLGE